MESNDNMNNLDNTNKMGEMPVGRLIFHMSWPAVLSMFIQPCFAFPAAVPHASVISPLTCRKACSGSILQNPDLRSVP